MSERKEITLLELQRMIKARLDDALPLPVWVAAEIGELKVNRSGHCYLELVEKGGANGVPQARVSAVVWRNTWGAMSPYFRSATGTQLAAGMRVLLRVSVTYHELYGLSLTVADIDPLYTLGDLERQRQETIARLRDEGVFDMNRALELPPVVQRVAVVSSSAAAGYQDFVNQLAASGCHFDITLFDAVMQGHGAEESIIGALERIPDELFDVVVIIRGGGSQTDLAAFDSYRLASHVAQFPLPIVAGIGHDKDQSVVDLVAGVSLKTPTAVAAWLVDGLAEVDGYLDELSGSLTEAAVAVLDGSRNRLRDAAMGLTQASHRLTRSLDVRLERLRTLLNERVAAAFLRSHARLDLAAGAVAARRPDAILSLGFAIVRHRGKAVTDASALHSGDTLNIEFAHGTAITEVKNGEH